MLARQLSAVVCEPLSLLLVFAAAAILAAPAVFGGLPVFAALATFAALPVFAAALAREICAAFAAALVKELSVVFAAALVHATSVAVFELYEIVASAFVLSQLGAFLSEFLSLLFLSAIALGAFEYALPIEPSLAVIVDLCLLLVFAVALGVFSLPL